MRNRVDELRKKMDAKRKKRDQTRQHHVVRERDRGLDMMPFSMKHDEEREDTLYSFDDRRALPQEKGEAYFNKDRFLMQVLASICLFFAIGILFQSQSSYLEGVRGYVHHSFQEDFQFGAVANWYEEAFGRPLALLPPDMDVVAPGDPTEEDSNVYALPATGTVRESFQQNGRGIYVETALEEPVQVIRSGEVLSIEEDIEGEWGIIIRIRHYDGGEAWYGMLDNITVELNDQVNSGDTIGSVSPHNELDGIGVYYFALKEGETFVDPIDVISLD
ncbi:stage IV sporulation protein FA [Evansella vedderi]|uniref:Stage IV sporulation protein FA n=1 Tax=Evansella vedderi TaxID=38282 RepID=A0ABT9ZZ39_9BACI|nr:M23 family metallopeptidase [Evansella vedderi]MDQ0256519.1 stage IV sporulation protein FA [Evansella vedderi]